MAFCPNCGSEHAEGQRFCPNCGTKFPEVGTPAGQPPPLSPPPANTGRGFGRAVGIGCGTVILIFIVLAVIGLLGNSLTGNSTHTQAPRSGKQAPKARPAAPAKPQVLLDVEGNGIKQTQRFEAPNEWAIIYTFDCSNFGQSGNFAISVEGDTTDLAANQLAARGHDVNYEHGGGNVYLSINSECDWHVRAVAQ